MKTTNPNNSEKKIISSDVEFNVFQDSSSIDCETEEIILAEGLSGDSKSIIDANRDTEFTNCQNIHTEDIFQDEIDFSDLGSLEDFLIDNNIKLEEPNDDQLYYQYNNNSTDDASNIELEHDPMKNAILDYALGIDNEYTDIKPDTSSCQSNTRNSDNVDEIRCVEATLNLCSEYVIKYNDQRSYDILNKYYENKIF